MYRKIYVPTPYVQKSRTPPPAAYDFKFIPIDINKINDIFGQDNIKFSFTFKKSETQSLYPAYEFLIDAVDLDYVNEDGENKPSEYLKSFVQKAEKPIYIFWDRGAESNKLIYVQNPAMTRILPITNYGENMRIYVTPINDYGRGKTTTFLFPLKNLFFVLSGDTYNNPYVILSHYWHLFSETPEDRKNRPKVMYMYLNVEKEIVENDRTLLSLPMYQFTSLTDYKYINDHTYRWLINQSGYFKLSFDGWTESTEEEQEFIYEFLQSLISLYHDNLENYNLSSEEQRITRQSVLKVGIENPRDPDDTIIIYFMEGTSWQM